MTYDFQVEINLSDNSTGNVFLKVPESMEQDSLLLPFELFLYGCYVVKTFTNLGNHAVGHGLARSLTLWEPPLLGQSQDDLAGDNKYIAALHTPMYYAALKSGLDESFVKDRYEDSLYLVQGEKHAKKRFVGKLVLKTLTDSRFKLSYSGFGIGGLLAGIGLPMYSSNSAMLFATALFLRNSRSDGYGVRLQGINHLFANAYEDGLIFRVPNLEFLAITIVSGTLGVNTVNMLDDLKASLS